jgi:hypothetical protein
MALDIKGNWLSHINIAPPKPPNEGYFTINPPDPQTGAFTGKHHHPDGDFAMTGTYTEATTTPLKPDHMEFSGRQVETGCTFSYRGDIVQVGPDLITQNGKRHKNCGHGPSEESTRDAAPAAPQAPDDDWVGTHTT